jgi:hypothetical protein
MNPDGQIFAGFPTPHKPRKIQLILNLLSMRFENQQR